jgi:hypothetical protein
LLSLSLGLLSCSPAPSEDTFKDAQRAVVEDLVDRIAFGYDKIEVHDPQNMTTEMKVDVELSPEILSMLRSSTAENFDWLNDISLTLKQNIKDQNSELDLDLMHNGNELISTEFIIDTLKGDFYWAIPALTNEYLKLELGYDMTSVSVAGATTADILEILPSEQTLKQLIFKYYDIVMNNVTGVVYENGTLSVCEVEQESIVYEVTLSRKQIMEAAVDVLEAVKSDDDIKDIICDFAEYTIASAPSTSAYVSVDDIYDDFVRSIDEIIADANYELESGENNDAPALKWTSYTTKKAEVIATELEFIGDSSYFVFVGKAQDGENIGVQIYAGDDDYKDFEIKGELTEKRNVQSGTYEITVEGESMFFIDLENVDTKLLDKGYLNGTVSLCPSKGLTSLLTDELGGNNFFSGLAIASASIKLDIEQNKDDHAKLTATLMNGSSPYFSITLGSSVSAGTPIELPSNNNVTTNTESWVVNMDFEEFKENISNSGLPKSIVELVTYYIDALESELQYY